MGILWSILVLSVLIFVHELGHFLLAKWCGVGVVKFSIGFGPALYKFRKGETVYQLSAIPLGGFVRMVGDMPDMITGPQETDAAVSAGELDASEAELLSDRSRWFVEKSLLARSAIVFAGPFFNFVFAIFLLSITPFIYGQDFLVSDPVIGEVVVGSPAERAGLMAGDKVARLNGNSVADWDSLAEGIRNGSSAQVNLEIERAGETSVLEIIAEKQKDRQMDGSFLDVFLIGIRPMFEKKSVGLIESLELGVIRTVRIGVGTCVGLWGMITGKVSPKELAGPVFIFGETKRQADKGLADLFSFMAVLSVSLGVLNLLPIPVLDGGHLLFFLMEALLGPISMRKREFAQQVGMVFLLFLMSFAIYNDFSREPVSPESRIEWNASEDKKDGDNAPDPIATGQ